MLCYQLLVNWTERLSTQYLAFVLRIRINNFLSLQIRPVDLCLFGPYCINLEILHASPSGSV